MRRVLPGCRPHERLPDVPLSRIPRHVAVIMDGNGRWASERGFHRAFGHRAGAGALRTFVEECGALGIEAATFYSFSAENWRRPRPEVDALMELALLYLDGQQEALIRENIRFRILGRREGLPPDVARAIDRVEAATAGCTGAALCLAFNYGARAEIVDAARRLARDAAAGRLDPGDIDEHAVAGALYTAGLPEPDLLIRTAGELRVSNFLLWQIAYAEIHVTPVCWPDFTADHLHAAVRDFASRRRTFGGLDSDAPSAPSPAPDPDPASTTPTTSQGTGACSATA